ncbi:hypothetical protein ACHAPY_011151 [Fusarium culmorum]
MIQITRRAIDNASVAGQNPSTYSSDIALHLNERFLELGYLDNLEEIIRFSHKAIDDILERLSDRFERAGLLSHMTKALEANWEVLDNIPKDHPQMALCLNGVMAQLGARYLRVGALRDLGECIQIG